MEPGMRHLRVKIKPGGKNYRLKWLMCSTNGLDLKTRWKVQQKMSWVMMSMSVTMVHYINMVTNVIAINTHLLTKQTIAMVAVMGLQILLIILVVNILAFCATKG